MEEYNDPAWAGCFWLVKIFQRDAVGELDHPLLRAIHVFRLQLSAALMDCSMSGCFNDFGQTSGVYMRSMLPCRGHARCISNMTLHMTLLVTPKLRGTSNHSVSVCSGPGLERLH